ncbi:protein of unknown function [Streptosporangium subroseum]|uniref:DUF4328 domain-containing protein n=1 Tax=Streptosporangium subroseum TaxID=106412 RepID=A0A239KDR2_9ACTN|nr:DUF4328 domain-containing protein [Streptosporangium subroseum]SNT15803.1 protein of unknown function [Streptosporangium subroseum]
MRFISSPQKSPQKRSASAVYVTLSAQVLATAALVVFEQARGRRLAREISALGGDPHAPGAQAVVGAVSLFAVLIMFAAVTTIAAVIACLAWLIRARQDAGQARPAAPSVLAGWFVPGVNLIAPPVMMDRLWWASRPPADRRTRWLALLAAWWLSWLAALTLVLVRLLSGPSQGGTSLTGLGPTELAAITVAALLCAATVRQITRIQAVSGRHRTPESRVVPRPFPLSVSQVATEPVPLVAAEPTPHLTSQAMPQAAPK